MAKSEALSRLVTTNARFVFPAVALIALVACLAPAVDAYGTTQDRTLYDQSSIDSRINAEVDRIQALYAAQGQAAFATITSAGLADANTAILYVVNADTLQIVAHASDPGQVGQVAQTLREADKSYSQIRADLAQNDRIWVTNIDTNPANLEFQTARTLLHLHDGYIFAAGHLLPDTEIQLFIEEKVKMYDSYGDAEAFFDSITPDNPVLTDELYLFVIDYSAWMRVADEVVPARVGQSETILDTSARSVEDVLADLGENEGTWAEYTFHNPGTDIIQIKRTWLYLYDGYVFGSGYYPSDSRAQAQADSAQILYAAHGQDAFGMITPTAPDPLSVQSTFVLDATTLDVVAHAKAPNLVGTANTYLDAADRPLETILAELQDDGVWVWHLDRNPATQTNQLTRTYLTMYDGYLFGASYSLPDLRAQSVSDDAVYTYRSSGEAAFDVINTGVLNKLDVYPLVRSSTHILAHGTVPAIVGPLPDVQLATGTYDLSGFEDGDSFWSQYSFFDANTGIYQTKRAYGAIYDGYAFISPYTIADADTQSVTDYARFIYESDRESNAWVDIITPDAPVITDDLYPFVIDAATWTRLADGVVPARVGQAETILDTSGRSVEDVLADLEENDRTWLTYTFHNPATGVEQLKRTYLQLRDGIVFGSGYYILDSRVQGLAYTNVLTYNNLGSDVALARVNTVPEEPVSTYGFVVNPHTGTTMAQSVDPDLIDNTNDWDAIVQVLSVEEILDVTGSEPGMWVSYTHTEPVTGQEEAKRTWLILNDGLIFGSGYYSSNIPESDVQFAVSNAIRTYEANKENDAWVDIITPDAPIRTDAMYPFVIDAATWTRLADGVVPARVGQPETILDTSSRSVEDVLADLEVNGATWATYLFHNPATGVEQLKRSYLEMRDGMVFGSGYYTLDSEVQSTLHGRILEYERDGRDASLASINTIPDEPVSTYVFAADQQSGTTVAQNVDANLIDNVPDWDAITAVIPEQDIIATISKGTGMWVSYAHTNPVNGQDEIKRTWLVMHDGLVFGSGYYSSNIPESDVQFAVSNAIRTYEANKENDAWVDIITPDAPIRTDAMYPFVIDAATWTRLADGVVPARVGQPETILDTSSRSVEDVLADLEVNGATWATYLFHNPATGVEQLKRSYLQLRDGIVFGSGYYALDAQVQTSLNGRILEYERDGRDAVLASINVIPDDPVSTYVFAVAQLTGTTVAQGVDSNLIDDTNDWDAITAVIPVQDIMDVISKGSGMWVSYEHTNPVTGQDETKRTWIVLHGGLIFGSGYYSSNIPESDVQFAVSNAIRTYEANKENDAWVDIITPDAPIRTDAMYPFVIDAATWTRLADGVVPARVGQPETILDTSSRSVEDVLADLEVNGATWATYLFHNPATGVEQLKRSYLQLRDGIVFGSGYYALDAQVQTSLNGRILEYERDGRDAVLASINVMPDEPVSTYVFAVDQTGTTVAQGVDSNLIDDTNDWDAVTAVIPAQGIIDTISKGTGMWVSYEHTNPVTGQDETKRTWIVLHGGLIFGSGYYSSNIPESDVQFAVSNAIRTYEANKENDAWVDIITPDAPIRTDAMYPFVIDAATWTRLADGVVPARVGQPETILDTSSRSVEDVLADLEVNGATWATYLFHNPATGVEQLKRSYLQLRDGIVFGSGYYALDAQVQTSLNGRILEYERDGRDAVLASINVIPDDPVSTYAFVVDQTGTTVAQGVDSDLIGDTPDWDAIVAIIPEQDIIDVLSRGSGMWVSYEHTNPVSGQEEDKRTWLVMHGGLIFGSGYHP